MSSYLERRWARSATGALILSVIFIVLMVSSVSPEPISSDWNLVEYKVNGQITKAENLTSEEAEKAPAFKYIGEHDCEISLNGKTHKGYMTESGKGKYRITFDDTDQTMRIVIKGKNMTITNEKNTVKLVFKAE